MADAIWAATAGQPAIGRAEHVAVGLPGDAGNVLILGGSSPATSEVYWPLGTEGVIAGHFRAVNGALVNYLANQGCTLTAFPNGQALAVGLMDTLVSGLNDGCALFYGGDNWNEGIASLATPRAEHTATLLPEGDVLVTGGRGNVANALDSCALFNGTTWSDTGTMAASRRGHTATLLADGTVLVVGGRDVDSAFVTAAEIYDPNTGLWAPTTGGLNTARYRHSAILMNDNRVLVVGGTDGFDNPLTSCEVYDPATGLFSPTGDLNIAWGANCSICLLTDSPGSVFAAGGAPSYSATDTSETYNPGTGLWTASATMIRARLGHSTTLLSDGTVLVVGGRPNGEGTPLRYAEIWTPPTPAPAPTIDSLAPAVGSTAGGEYIGINGTGFVDGCTVAFDGVPVEVWFGSDTYIEGLTVPHGAGVVDVTVTNPDAQAATLPASLTYVGAVDETGSRTFVAYDENGGPLPGLTDLAFTFYELADGTPVYGLDQPTFFEVGEGRYGFVPLASSGWCVIHCPGSIQAYHWFNLADVDEGFILYDMEGVPLEGASIGGMSFIQYRNEAGEPIGGDPPIISEVGGGLYSFPRTIGTRYIISTGATPEFVERQVLESTGGGGGGATPVVSNVTPAAGSPITAFTAISLDVTVSPGSFRLAELHVEFAGSKVFEVAHDGSDFGPMYRGSSNRRSTISHGYRYTLLRDGGWPSSPTMTPIAIDTTGTENA